VVQVPRFLQGSLSADVVAGVPAWVLLEKVLVVIGGLFVVAVGGIADLGIDDAVEVADEAFHAPEAAAAARPRSPA
jgi:hypothetical protein